MVIDTSAIIAIFSKESGYERLISVLAETDETLCISAPTVLETYFVIIHRYGEEAWQDITEFLQEYEIEIVAVGAHELSYAMRAFVATEKAAAVA